MFSRIHGEVPGILGRISPTSAFPSCQPFSPPARVADLERWKDSTRARGEPIQHGRGRAGGRGLDGRRPLPRVHRGGRPHRVGADESGPDPVLRAAQHGPGRPRRGPRPVGRARHALSRHRPVAAGPLRLHRRGRGRWTSRRTPPACSSTACGARARPSTRPAADRRWRRPGTSSPCRVVRRPTAAPNTTPCSTTSTTHRSSLISGSSPPGPVSPHPLRRRAGPGPAGGGGGRTGGRPTQSRGCPPRQRP